MAEQDDICNSKWEAPRGKSSADSAWSWIPIMRDPGWIRNVWPSNINVQTMNYVGQLAGQVFVTVKELYKGLNPATLSGCIDIIVVRQPNGSLQCSPFHVRFGKMGVLRSREKVVDIEINGESVDLHMKLGDNGEAFFVQETDNDQEVIPMYLATSPILSEGASRMESQLKRNSVDRIRCLDPTTAAQGLPSSDTPSAGSLGKKRRKRRRKSQLDNLKRDENVNTSEDEDMFPIEMSSDEDAAPMDGGGRTLPNDVPPFQDDIPKENLPSISSYPQSASYPNSDREWSPSPSPSGSRPSTPKSDSELVSKSADRSTPKSNLEMLWLWGELPQAAKTSSPHKMKDSSPLGSRKIPDKIHFQAIHSESSDTFSDQSPTLAPGPLVQQSKTQMEMQFVNEEDLEALGASAPPLPVAEELKPPAACTTQAASKTDSPSRKKDKRSRHLGADGVYLDDLTDMDPEVAALYFPKNGDPAGLPKQACDNGARSANQSPQSVGSSGIDSGVESTSDGLRDLPSIAISLCGGLSDHRDITKDAFLEQAVSYQQFADNPAIIDDPNLVVKIGNKYYNWTTAAPLLLAMQAFQKPLPKSSCLSYLHVILDAIRFCLSKIFSPPTATVESIMRDKMPKKGGRWWFSWRGRNATIKEESKPEQCLPGTGHGTEEQLSQLGLAPRGKHESSSSDEEHSGAQPSSSSHLSLLSNVSYKKTLRLTSEQLKSLKLKNGPNDVVFSVTTQYQGTCRCEGTIYLWNWDDKVIISDIDGTITRSDTLGHILPTLGKDWTHQGIAKLYHKVSQNGYKFLYCSARAIGMADMTRGYLHWVNERGTVLPQGPLLLSPSSLFSALHREVIEKKPEKFKVQCLTDIKNLFFPNTEPFYAAFGNRPADVYSYKQVGVSLNRIFTVNPKGELVQEHAKTNISSYVRLCEVVDHVFPLLKRSHSSDFPCSDTFSNFTFWREPLLPFENQDVHSASA
ncbi:phosphatidate phosphatase LPIN1 isoform X6 [Peromyscus californicus insignis]|uniref:phosphatidate phosphatase LPIN1 isoform X6 n=1 Tax=Peromyscus californicus insignis TaxID=564181 RepID=UPI0022A77473|nr:phosphatidate phosphatase LPIN1 isoform X6 [Peromyscus californicus insignis]